MKWQDFVAGADGAKRLASLKSAVAKMKSLDESPPNSADFRRSWIYWANIHGYLGRNSHFGTLNDQEALLRDNGLAEFLPYLEGSPGKPGLKDQTPPDAIASAVWATCQHSRPSGPQANFFGWHRMYLYYFERILRWAANDSKLTLPYWDYTDPDQTALPAEFRDVNSPLYDWRRLDDLNQGRSTLNPLVTDIDGALGSSTNYLDYELAIENGVHGNVHCSVVQTCPVAVMGLVAVAANDPVFYAHHTNIDRFWSCWRHAHPAEVPGPWQNASFSFVDETGAKVTRKVKDFIDTATLGYVYDNEADCMRKPQPTPVAAVSAQVVMAGQAMNAASQPVRLNAPVTAVKVTLPGPTVVAGTAAQPTLVLRDVSAKTNPGALLGVYIADGRNPAVRQYVGAINWFGVFDHMAGMGNRQRVSRTFRFNISKHLDALGLGHMGEVIVTLQATPGTTPKPGAAASTPTPTAFSAQSDLTVGNVEVQ